MFSESTFMDHSIRSRNLKHLKLETIPHLQATSEFDQINTAQNTDLYQVQGDIRQLPLTISETGSSSDKGSKRKAQSHDVDGLSPSSKQKMHSE